MMSSPLRDQYDFVHFESGSRGAESPSKDESLSTTAFRVITSPFMLAWRIMRSRPAVVHINSVLDHKAFWRDLIYLMVSKMLMRNVVFQFHGGSLDALCSKKFMHLLVRAVLSVPDAVVLLATSERRDLERLGINKRLFVIANGVDVSEYCGNSERVHSGSVQRLVYMGRLVREKGLFEAIKAVDFLRTEDGFKNIELQIAGSGPAREEIEKFVSDRGLGSQVKLVGAMYGSAKVLFLRNADVFLFPSYHKEGLPYCIIESLAAGTPVIASRLAGIPDVVTDGEHGVLIKPGDTAEIVKAVRQLSSSQEALRLMSKNCIAWAKQGLGLDRLAREFGELYQKVARP